MKTRATAAVTAIVVAAVAGAMVISSGHSGSTSSSADGRSAAAGVGRAAQPDAVTSANAAPTVPPLASFRSPASGKYLGVALPDQASASDLARFEKNTGSTENLREEFVNFGQAPPLSRVLDGYAHNALTVLSWLPQDTSLAAIDAGKQDAYISGFAGQVAESRVPVAIDFANEFNGNWMPWGAGGSQHTTAAQFVKAWQRVHDLFTVAGATNVIWVWSPNVVNPVPSVNLASYWPGAAYVDWIGLSAYWTGELGEDSWAGLIAPTEAKLLAFTDDPIVITETGAQQGAQKAAWVSAMLDGLLTDKRVLGLIYFDYGVAQHKRSNWTLEDDPAAVTAWRVGAAKIPLVPINRPSESSSGTPASGGASSSASP